MKKRTVLGKKVELIVKDDTAAPDVTKRLAQELVVNEKVQVLAGFGLTPLALSTAPIATQSKTPLVVMAAATSSITQASPYIIRTSFTLPQAAVAMGDWAPRNGIKKVVSLVSDYGPGIDAEKFFKDRFLFNGGQVLETLRVPMRNPDFAPFLQKVRDLKPDALYVFVPSFQKANGGLRPNFMAVGGYDGMRVIYEALRATKGQGGGDALLAAMKGQIFESPRGPMFIDAQTRDVVHNIYIRKVERVNGQLFNNEFESLKDVKDPGKSR